MMPRIPVQYAPITSETMAYLHCWLKAHEQGQFVIQCKDRKDAERIKFLLYRVARQLLAQPDMAAEFPQFLRARHNCSARAEQTADGDWQVLVYRSDQRREVKSLIDRLGLTDDDLRIPEKLSEQAMLEGLRHQLSAAPTAPEVKEPSAPEPAAPMPPNLLKEYLGDDQ